MRYEVDEKRSCHRLLHSILYLVVDWCLSMHRINLCIRAYLDFKSTSSIMFRNLKENGRLWNIYISQVIWDPEIGMQKSLHFITLYLISSRISCDVKRACAQYEIS